MKLHVSELYGGTVLLLRWRLWLNVGPTMLFVCPLVTRQVLPNNHASPVAVVTDSRLKLLQAVLRFVP